MSVVLTLFFIPVSGVNSLLVLCLLFQSINIKLRDQVSISKIYNHSLTHSLTQSINQSINQLINLYLFKHG